MIVTNFPEGGWKEYVDEARSRLYTVRWDKTNATLTRLNAAAGITTDTTHFAHHGSVDPAYDNPFDKIYPWSGIKLCNIDITRYLALKAGDSITDCVIAWEGDPDFKYEHENGVWRYCPEFWGRSWDDDAYRYFEVTDSALGGYIHYPESIKGRWHGVKKNMTIGEEGAKDILLPLVAQPPEADTSTLANLHTFAKNGHMTVDNIYTWDADNLLYLVEFANMNCQTAVGYGVDAVYQAGNKHVKAAVTDSNTVTINTTDKGVAQVGAIFAVGAANDRGLVSRSVITNIADADGTTTLTLDRKITVTADQFWNIHGMSNTKDDAIGSKSGYIGTNGKCIAYYRGLEMWGNMFFYCLGTYRAKTGEYIYVAKSREDCNNYDALDTSKHLDTKITLPARGEQAAAFGGYINKLGTHPFFSAAPFCTEINNGASDQKPVGDYCWMPANTVDNTILLLGGDATSGLACGLFYGRWAAASSAAWWNSCARPSLINP